MKVPWPGDRNYFTVLLLKFGIKRDCVENPSGFIEGYFHIVVQWKQNTMHDIFSVFQKLEGSCLALLNLVVSRNFKAST